MFQKDPSNTIFQLALDLVNQTSQHIFLTGKAGTGKTSFLKQVQENTKKNAIVVAPTGVAAINAGGVTMHSFFQLPRGMFIPGVLMRDDFIGFAEVTDRQSLFKNIHFTGNKRQLLQELELLIIDEVSMMRCDMLDAIDTILRHFRKTPFLPFGGVQVLYIGDLYQLPPVVANNEWSVLQQYYASPFFFSSKAVAEAPPLYIELKKIYRQNEQEFIEVLNRIRNNNTSHKDFEYLNRKYNPGFSSTPENRYITITTHNNRAETINIAELNKLPGRAYSFKAQVKDDFSDKAFPADPDLQLKVGAQVMFIKNDNSPERRYYNGKLAVVKEIEYEEITVQLENSNTEIVLEKETWKNVRYIYNQDNDDIDEEVLGSFTQYPIRLAWAITIHKSQGLTFEKAVIDAGNSFAAGQVYVALSRCTSMEGIILKSRIYPSSVSTDPRIVEFTRKKIDDTKELEKILEKEKYSFWGRELMKIFDLSKLSSGIYDWLKMIPDVKVPDAHLAIKLAQDLLTQVKEQAIVAQKFQKQLSLILSQTEQTKDTLLLEERMTKAIAFFSDELVNKTLLPLQEHISSLKHASKLKKYKAELKKVEMLAWNQVQRLVSAQYDNLQFADRDKYHDYNPLVLEKEVKQKAKIKKGSSVLETFELFKNGKNISEIAQLRNMAISTIEGHLGRLVSTGEIKANELVPDTKISVILKVIEDVGVEKIGLIKSKLSNEYSFHDVIVASNHYRYQKSKQPA